MIKPQYRLITGLLISIVLVLMGISASTVRDPFNYESFPHADLVEIRLKNVTPERVIFKKFSFTFYVKGEAEFAGEIGSKKAYIFKDSEGTFCVVSLDPVQQIGSVLSDDGHTCLDQVYDLDESHVLTMKWFHQSGKDSATGGPIWASR